MTPSVARSGLFTMGSVCSSLSSKKSRRGKGSHASSSDVALEVDKHRPSSGSGSQKAPPAVKLEAPSSPAKPQSLASLGVKMPSPSALEMQDVTSLSLQEGASECASTMSVIPPCAVPPQLSRVLTEMQNLLMGRWPVLPSPGSRVLRLFLACEEADSLAERMWLYKEVFPDLRLYTETMGFHLHIVDVHALAPTPYVPRYHLNAITNRAMDDNVDMWMIFLNGKLGWHLPTTIEAKDFKDIHRNLVEGNAQVADFMYKTYRLDENNVPPVYYLLPAAEVDRQSSCSCASKVTSFQELFDELCYIVTESQFETYLTEGFQQEASTALSRHSSMLDNVLVVCRTITGLPKDRSQPANQRFLDIDSAGETNQILLQKNRLLNSRMERIVSNECILKFTTPWTDMEQALQGKQTPYLKNLCQSVEIKLKAAVSRMVERQTSIDPYLAEGLPPVLCQELLMHAHKQQQLLTSCDKPREFVSTALELLHQPGSNLPFILHGPLGCGLHTIAAHLAREEAKRDCTRTVALRFMALTPESQTILAVLFTVLEQVTIVFGETTTFRGLTDLTCSSILACMGSCMKEESITMTIILCGAQWCMMGRKDQEDITWLTETLHPNISMVIVTSCPKLGSVDNSRTLQIPDIQYDLAAEIFQTNMENVNRRLTEAQQSIVMAVLKRHPLPALAMSLASVASEWRSNDSISPNSVPDNVKDAISDIFKQSEKVVGKDCTAIIVGYLSIAKFGLSDSELQDVLALDSRLMGVLYPKQRPQLRHCPLSICLYLKHKLSPLLDTAYVYGHRVCRWQKMYSSLLQDYFGNNEETFHAQLADLFSSSWANKPKPMEDPERGGAMVPVPWSSMEQPDSYDRHTNCRKFLCLLHHMLQGLASQGRDVLTERSTAAKQHLLNLRWLVTKLDATSLVQLLDDLQMAISTAATISKELSWLQLLVARYTSALCVSGLQLRSHLHAEIALIFDNGASPDKDLTRNKSFTKSVEKLDQAITKSSIPFLVFQKGSVSSDVSNVDEAEDIKSDAVGVKPKNTNGCSCVNGFFSYEKDGKRVVSISSSAGEIVVWDTVSHQAIQTMKNINKPMDLVFLDSQRIVVLCNRELKAFDLESGTLISNIRGMLNIKMPYFHVRDANTVIVLARNRMSVNVLDVNTGQIHATFKAGEDRFLNSLLVSGNGKMLVCGDETQKPSPLLVWELGQSKLLHDLRLPQHEFIPSIADITDNGHYVACACKGLYDTAFNFVVVYDLMSGQLYRQFRMNASVTALSVTSGSQRVIMTLNDGSLAVFDIVAGNCVYHLDGVKAIYNRVQSTDETLAVSYSINAGSMPIACTVALWNIDKGRFLASYTFDSMVTGCHLVTHNTTILVGLASCRHYVILSLFGKQSPMSASTAENGSSKSLDGSHTSSEHQPLWRLVQ